MAIKREDSGTVENVVWPPAPPKKIGKGRGKELANAHWEYISGLLDAHGTPAGTIALIEYHYTTAFVHGYKHGQEDVNGEHHDK